MEQLVQLVPLVLLVLGLLLVLLILLLVLLLVPLLVLLVLLLLLASVSSAQTVTNPGTVEFTASSDHAILTSYVLGHFLPGATTPMQEVDLGKPTPNATTQLIVATINTRPIAFGLGAGSVSRRPLGMAVVGGMITEIQLLPTLYQLQRDGVVALLGEVASSRSLAAAPEAQKPA